MTESRSSPITYVDRVRVPVMIMAGEYDPRSPIRSIEAYVQLLQELGKPHEFYRFAGGHGAGGVMDNQETLRQLEMQIAFAARCLGTTPPL